MKIDEEQLFRDVLHYVGALGYAINEELEDETQKNKCLRYLFDKCRNSAVCERGDKIYFAYQHENYEVTKNSIRHVSENEMKSIFPIDFIYSIEGTVFIYDEETEQYEKTKDKCKVLESILDYFEVNSFKLTDKDLEEKYLKFLFEFCNDYAIYISKHSKIFKTEKTYFKVDAKYKLTVCTKSEYLELILKNKRRIK